MRLFVSSLGKQPAKVPGPVGSPLSQYTPSSKHWKLVGDVPAAGRLHLDVRLQLHNLRLQFRLHRRNRIVHFKVRRK